MLRGVPDRLRSPQNAIEEERFGNNKFKTQSQEITYLEEH